LLAYSENCHLDPLDLVGVHRCRHFVLSRDAVCAGVDSELDSHEFEDFVLLAHVAFLLSWCCLAHVTTIAPNLTNANH